MRQAQQIEDAEIWFRVGKNADLEQVKNIFLAKAETNPQFRVRFVTILSEENPLNIFNEWVPNGYSIDFDEKIDFSLLKLKRTIERKNLRTGERTIQGDMGIFKNTASNVWTIFTTGGGEFFSLGVVRFLEKYYPQISMLYLSSNDLRTLFNKLSRQLNCDAIVKKAISYTHGRESKIDHKWNPTQVVFDEADDTGRFVDKVEFILKKEDKTLLHAFTSRNGVSKYYSGDIRLFFDTYLDHLSKVGTNKVNFFSKKERKFGEWVVNPIYINYDNEVFTEQKDNIRFINTLSELEHTTISVLHSNPYVHLTLLDFRDGSSFDVFATSSNKITLIPGFRSSFSTLMRVCNQIFEGFREGELTDKPDGVDQDIFWG